jgi:hypothetical protein
LFILLEEMISSVAEQKFRFNNFLFSKLNNYFFSIQILLSVWNAFHTAYGVKLKTHMKCADRSGVR